MIAKIKKSDLIILSKNANDEITGFKLNIENLILENVVKERVLDLNNRLRRFSRVADNFRRTSESLERVENLVKELGHSFGFDPVVHALFCHAVILYGACFVQGEDGYPLRELYSDISKNELHLELMSIRNKRFGHIDSNHDVRTDELLWQVTVDGDYLVPQTSAMRGSFLTLPSLEFIGSCKIWIDSLLERIAKLKENLRIEIGSIIGPIKPIEA